MANTAAPFSSDLNVDLISFFIFIIIIIIIIIATLSPYIHDSLL